MKKTSLLLLAVMMISVATGCGKEEVVTSAICTKQESSYTNTTKLTATDDEINKLEVTYVYENSIFNIESFNDVTDDQKEQIKTNMLTTLGFNDKNYEGFSIDITFDDRMTVKMIIDIKTVDQEALDKVGLNFDNTNMDMSDAIQSYKDTGYTCE